MDGKLEKEYGIHCPRCERAFLGLGNTYEQTCVELRMNGWTKPSSGISKGLWICPACVAKEKS